MNKTVLIIDDELDLRELLKLTLAKMDIDSTAVETVKEAKTALQEKTFDLCLTDMRLPDGNGLELVDYVQKNYPQLPIAVLTAYGNNVTSRIAQESKMPRATAINSSTIEKPD
jgi:two-component system response regulator PilR (NtrC family)